MPISEDLSNGTEPKRIRIALVDDHPAVLLGLGNMLAEEPDFQLVGSFAAGDALKRAVFPAEPHIILLDLRMPGMGGQECLAYIRTALPRSRVLIHSSYDMDGDIIRSLEGGAAGFLSKSAGQEEVARAIRRIHLTGRYIPARVARIVEGRNERDDLTERELEVLRAVARGDTSKEIAEHLHLSHFTVRNHINSILSKLRVRDRTEAAVVALKSGILSLDDV